MKILYLLPPSEWKNPLGIKWAESLSFAFEKPMHIAKNATERDLKCKEKRYEEGIELNTHIEDSPILPAIERYSGVMYTAIGYDTMSKQAKTYFQNHFLILSGMYGILKPTDMIGNYKLPIETKWLKDFWGSQITETLNDMQVDVVVDVLPKSYAKMIDWSELKAHIIRINFLHNRDWKLQKMTHGVKKVKGEYIYQVCQSWGIDISDLDMTQKIHEIERMVS